MMDTFLFRVEKCLFNHMISGNMFAKIFAVEKGLTRRIKVSMGCQNYTHYEPHLTSLDDIFQCWEN
jgi:hypothetical protein